MRFSLIICTYQRPKPLVKLLHSVKEQTLYPHEILVIDGSVDTATQEILTLHTFQNLIYYKVPEAQRGLTKQRNFGIKNVASNMDIVCFLDDDIVLTPNYFKELIGTYKRFPEALGVGGYIINEIDWRPLGKNEKVAQNQFAYDGWVRKDGARFVLRKRVGLDTDRPPAHLPDFSHGRSVSFLPPSGKIYSVEQFMGGVASYQKNVFKSLNFSAYFEGYGLYEDADFTLRLSKKGPLYVNTAAQLYHFHEPLGRPNQFLYGKMVVRNGWYVWRVRYPKPSMKARCKWHITALLLTLVRYVNAFKGPHRKAALSEALGRTLGWYGIIFNPPKIHKSQSV